MSNYFPACVERIIQDYRRQIEQCENTLTVQKCIETMTVSLQQRQQPSLGVFDIIPIWLKKLKQQLLSF